MRTFYYTKNIDGDTVISNSKEALTMLGHSGLLVYEIKAKSYQRATLLIGEFEDLSEEFAKELKIELGDNAFNEMVQKHIDGEYAKKDVCVTHDYCDGNQVMLDAYEKCYKREFNMQNDDDMQLWNGAWEFAKRNNFYLNK